MSESLNECKVCGSEITGKPGHRECQTCGWREWPMKPHGKPICEIICHADRRSKRCIATIAGNEHLTVPAACGSCEHSETILFYHGKVVRMLGGKRLQPIIEFKE